jgi:hypothetical protein
MSLVEVHAPLHADDGNVVDMAETKVPCVSEHLRRGDVRDLRVRHFLEVAEGVRERAESAPEDDAYAGADARACSRHGNGLVEARDDALMLAHEGRNAIMGRPRDASMRNAVSVFDGVDRAR